jgi:hypothetical protein
VTTLIRERLHEAAQELSAAQPQRFGFADVSIDMLGPPALVGQMTAAWRFAACAARRRHPLKMILWGTGVSPVELAPAEWRVPERWARREPVLFGTDAVTLYFDPIGRVMAVMDHEARLGGMWFERPDAPAMWVVAAPMLRVLDMVLTRLGLLLLHGAAIGRDGAAALILGPGGAGKSTLSLHAAQSGMDYLGDDYVLVDTRGDAPLVHAIFASAKLLEPGIGGGSASRIAVHRPPDADADKYFLLVEDRAMVPSAHIVAVLLPQFSKGAEARLEPISAGDVMKAVVPSAFRQLPGQHQEKLRLLRAALRVPNYRLALTPRHEENVAAVDSTLAKLRTVAAW